MQYLNYARQPKSTQYIRVLQVLQVLAWCLPTILTFIWGMSEVANAAAHGNAVPSTTEFLIVYGLMSLFITSLFAMLTTFEESGAFAGTETFWLPQAKCGELLDLCRLHPELEDYRRQVVGMSRRFTCSEFVAMRSWPEKKARILQEQSRRRAIQDQCKTLYEA